MAESESMRLTMGEGGSLGGVMSREGEVDVEADEGGGSSNWFLSLNAELVSGPEGNPDEMEKLLFCFVLNLNKIDKGILTLFLPTGHRTGFLFDTSNFLQSSLLYSYCFLSFSSQLYYS
ncbi:hypothetical protein CHARACLAT_024063 [Characodon lateralis]|uniref:Uncharacterized protein n=1 Tax=Characodon lateralis TaxID=208331 RepID=A0ABU7EGJ2_9TELE|nr:hypothetical protein [Characodon lateralis]